jgi:hypothetical protein
LATSSKSPSTSRGGGQRSDKPPPSSVQAPATTSSGPYAAGAVVLGLLIAGLLYWRCGSDEETPAPPAPVTTTPPEPTAKLPDFAPPPPPEDEDAGTDAGPAAPTGKAVTSAGGGACSACGKGRSNSKLESAVGQTAGLARGCYQRALRTGGSEGMIVISLSVGADGSVCGASVTKDTLNNPGVSQCAASKLSSRTYPKPDQGCVVVNVPINFEMKK